MGIEHCRAHLAPFGLDKHIMEFSVSSATVTLAAQAIGTTPARIAKSLAFNLNGVTTLIVTAGDVKIDNKKFKAHFCQKPKMLTAEEVLSKVGHEVGGVCPFGVAADVVIYCDESLFRFATVFPACGNTQSAIELTPEQITRIAPAQARIDVTRPMNTDMN